MITQLVNRGFKDQRRSVQLTGLDLFTSRDVNGVGKSSILESLKLALLGEIPGRAKSLDDLLQFSSFPEMSVKIKTSLSDRQIIAERKFFGDARKGEKRPIIIDESAFKFEEGDRWIRERIGAMSLGFDPYEFLNLTDAKKRQWIIAHSPESQVINREILYSILFTRLAVLRFGKGLVQEHLLNVGIENPEDLFEPTRIGTLLNPQSIVGIAKRLASNLAASITTQDSNWLDHTSKTLIKILNLWSESISAEENISAILAFLKAETLRLKNAACDQSSAISCLDAPNDHLVD